MGAVGCAKRLRPLTPLVELFWSKERILEVYLNVAEFDEGVFGAEAASPHYFGISSDSLTLAEAARLAAILPDPGAPASAPTQSCWTVQTIFKMVRF